MLIKYGNPDSPVSYRRYKDVPPILCHMSSHVMLIKYGNPDSLGCYRRYIDVPPYQMLCHMSSHAMPINGNFLLIGEQFNRLTRKRISEMSLPMCMWKYLSRGVHPCENVTWLWILSGRAWSRLVWWHLLERNQVCWLIWHLTLRPASSSSLRVFCLRIKTNPAASDDQVLQGSGFSILGRVT